MVTYFSGLQSSVFIKSLQLIFFFLIKKLRPKSYMVCCHPAQNKKPNCLSPFYHQVMLGSVLVICVNSAPCLEEYSMSFTVITFSSSNEVFENLEIYHRFIHSADIIESTLYSRDFKSWRQESSTKYISPQKPSVWQEIYYTLAILRADSPWRHSRHHVWSPRYFQEP